MKMDSKKMARALKERLNQSNRIFHFDSKQDTLRIENTDTQKGITVEIPKIVANWENFQEKAIDEVVYYVEEALKVMGEHHSLQGQEKHIFPVIRSTSFPEKTESGIKFLFCGDDRT